MWECPTNYVEHGTCTTSHLYQEVLLVKMAEALQVSSPGFCVEFFRPLSFVLLCVCFLLVAV